jgi:hypothetical protein
MSRFNRCYVLWLSSPAGFISGPASLVRYTGRISGKSRRLPVNAEPYEDGMLIRVGRPAGKTWWRNFKSPWPIELVRGPRVKRGTAVVVLGSTGRGQRIAADYFARHPGVAKKVGLPRMRDWERPAPEALQAVAADLVFVVVTPDL